MEYKFFVNNSLPCVYLIFLIKKKRDKNRKKETWYVVFGRIKKNVRLRICIYNIEYFFWESFNLWCPLIIIVLYHQTMILIGFWCRRWLNSKSLIQPSVLTETHYNIEYNCMHETCEWMYKFKNFYHASHGLTTSISNTSCQVLCCNLLF